MNSVWAVRCRETQVFTIKYSNSTRAFASIELFEGALSYAATTFYSLPPHAADSRSADALPGPAIGLSIALTRRDLDFVNYAQTMNSNPHALALI
jgi:hypothetical protein